MIKKEKTRKIMKYFRHVIPLLLAFWAGLVSAISFFEAWLKFRAEGVTLEIGLSIGKLVFTSLNRVEIVLLLLVWIILLIQEKQDLLRITSLHVMWWIVTCILSLQTVWLLPAMVDRAELLITGTQLQGSNLHFWFGSFEVIKVSLLIAISLRYKKIG